MKYILVLILLMVSLTAQVTPKAQFSTKLKVTVIDRLGNVVDGAVVSIYQTDDDYRKSVQPVGRDTTNLRGQVTFRKLDTISYWLEARKNDMSNDGEGVRTAQLQRWKTNLVNTVIQ